MRPLLGLTKICPVRRCIQPLDNDVSQPRPLVDRSLAVLLLKWQAIMAVVLALAALLIDRVAAISVGVGAGIAVLGSLYFAVHAFRYAGAQQAQKIAQSFYKGETGKFVITALLFAAVFSVSSVSSTKSLQAGWLLTGFIFEQLVAWGVMLIATTRSEQ